jgi:hypothetical protein
MMSLWRTGENLEKAEMHQSGFEHSVFFVSLWRIFKKGHGSEYCYFSLVFGYLKSFDMRTIYAIIEGNWGVLGLARNRNL